MKPLPARSGAPGHDQTTPPAAGRGEAVAIATALSPSFRDEGPGSATTSKTDLRYWEQRLVQSTYGKVARPRAVPELSARIEHGGISFFFPLDSHAKAPAAARALEIYQTVLAEGWPSALGRYAREFTLAVFWGEDPMIFTYTTLYTVADKAPANRLNRLPRAQQRAKVSVAIIEPDAGCGRALVEWIRSLPEYSCRGLFPSGAEALFALEHQPVDLVLFNRQLPDLAASELARTLEHSTPCMPAFGYRIYSTSDELFVSQPGKSGGYYFRRRPPQHLLEPIRDASRKSSPAEWHACVYAYVSKVFRFPLVPEDTHGPSLLTGREHDILNYLCQGRSDKGIACALNISVWTVHTHLKKIYEKLGAHSRTEAVIKYLQK